MVKEKKTVFQKLEEAQEKVKILLEKKEKEISGTICETFSFLMDEETFIKFSEKIETDEKFKENLEKFILKELNIPYKSKVIADKKEKNEEENSGDEE